MKKFLKKNIYLLLTFFAAFLNFFRSLFVFYTNDDFFFLHISNVKNLSGFLNFFSLSNTMEGFRMYRPLTTQFFYFIGRTIFNFSPVGLHIISFLFFFGTIYLVYQLALILFRYIELKSLNLAAFILTFLYAVSATHFGHLYYLATFQELGMTFFVLLTCLMFLKNKHLLALVFFILALMSKETAVVTPALLVLIYFFQKFNGVKVLSCKKLVPLVLSFLLALGLYLIFRFHFYGFASGDSYVWDFSVKKFINTNMWYLLWSLNIPESLVDFLGPGFHINPNLWLYWSKQIVPILVLFVLEMFIIIYVFLKSLISNYKSLIFVSVFSATWFIISLLPVAFLPIHKFTFYLTLPLIGLVFALTYVIRDSRFRIPFCIIWTVLSVMTVNYTVATSWITQGEAVSRRVYDYFSQNKLDFAGEKIIFIDTPRDATLPWSPTSVVRVALSENNFFKVFFPDLAANVAYTGKGNIMIESRQFLGY